MPLGVEYKVCPKCLNRMYFINGRWMCKACGLVLSYARPLASRRPSLKIAAIKL